MAIVLMVTPSRQSLPDGLVEGPIDGFYFIVFWLRKKLILHSSILCCFLSSSELDRPEIVLFALPLRPLPVAHPVLSLLHLTAFFG
jgi:hypothetical protein